LQKVNIVPLIRKAPPRDLPPPEAPKSLDELLQALVQGTTQERRAAAAELGGRGEGANELAARLPVEKERLVREAIGSALLRNSSQNSAVAIAPLLSADDATLRNEARELLHSLPNAEMVAEVLLRAADPDVRMFAIEILCQRTKSIGAHRIASVLRAENDVNVVAHGVEQLGLVGTAEDLPCLDEIRRRFPAEDYLCFTIDDARSSIATRVSSQADGREGES
jgi:hypothetical protein